MIYDICIVGAGPGMMGVLEGLKQKNYKGSILVIDKGKRIEDRTFDDRMHGFGGAGCYTDFKLMIDDYTGGYLGKYLSNSKFPNKAWDYIYKSKDFYIKNGAPNDVVSPDSDEEEVLCEKYGMKFIPTSELIHCGTDRAVEINKNIFNYFKDLNIEWKFETVVNSICKDKTRQIIHYMSNIFNQRWNYVKKIVIATGRSNTLNLDNLKIEYDNNVVDLGVRVEIDSNTKMKPWFDKFYHPKIEYITSTYNDKVRTFCSNPSGFVTVENYGDIKLVNGETYKDKKTDRTNFAALVSIPFTEPFKDGNTFARNIAKTVNQLNSGKPIVQSYRDLKHGRRSTWDRISNIHYQIDPNLIEPGDLSIVIPHRYMVDLIEFLTNLDKMFTGIVDNMLLYGLEAKFYANRPKFINDKFEVKDNLYFCGDCSGITRGIIQATAMGIYIGENL